MLGQVRLEATQIYGKPMSLEFPDLGAFTSSPASLRRSSTRSSTAWQALRSGVRVWQITSGGQIPFWGPAATWR